MDNVRFSIKMEQEEAEKILSTVSNPVKILVQLMD